MGVHRVIVYVLLLSSCASSNKEVVQGYDGTKLEKARRNLMGKSPEAVVKYLGNPVMQGKYEKNHRIIYLTKDMRRFYLNLSYNTDMEVDCLVFDFDLKNRLKSIQKFQKCNQKGGEILKFQDIDLK